MLRDFFETFGREKAVKETPEVKSNKDAPEFYEEKLKLTVEIETLVKEKLTLNTKIKNLESKSEPLPGLYDEGEKEWLASNPDALLEEWRLRLEEVEFDLIKLRAEAK